MKDSPLSVEVACYWGSISSLTETTLFEVSGEDGAYLIRDARSTSDPNCWTLAVRQGDKINRYRVTRVEVSEIVTGRRTCVNGVNGKPIMLTTPIVRPTVYDSPLSDEVDCYWGCISSLREMTLFMASGEDGAYLVRDSWNDPNCWTLAIRQGGNIHHYRVTRVDFSDIITGKTHFFGQPPVMLRTPIVRPAGVDIHNDRSKIRQCHL